jgi:hypothetical protein
LRSIAFDWPAWWVTLTRPERLKVNWGFHARSAAAMRARACVSPLSPPQLAETAVEPAALAAGQIRQAGSPTRWIICSATLPVHSAR